MAESNSKKIRTTKQDVERFLNIPDKYGYIGKLIPGINMCFYRVPFPHGNSMPLESRVNVYKAIKRDILSCDRGNIVRNKRIRKQYFNIYKN